MEITGLTDAQVQEMKSKFDDNSILGKMTRNKKDVSVIIPMYNAADFIEECLQSLLNQTLKNIEVIVVDDCSTDNSVEIVKNFSPKFEGRLNLIRHKKNSGYPGLPRNTALKSANGKYIYFLDSDDFISETALEDFFKVAEEFKADVVHSEKCFARVEENGEVKIEIESTQLGEFVTEPTLETLDIGKRVEDFIQRKYLWWGCNKLFRREFLAENKIVFPNMTSFEDYVFAFQCIVAAKNYVRVPFVSYYYRVRNASLSHKVKDVTEVLRNMATAVETMDNFMLNRKFFVDNPFYRYSIIDFFVQWRIDATSKNVFTDSISIGDIYQILYDWVFAEKTTKNAALSTYLFMSTNIYKLYTKKLSNQIKELKNKLENLQSQEENVN